MSGLFGKILRVDLSRSVVAEEAIPKDWVRPFMGGRGLAMRYLVEEIERGVDPLGPDNLLIFMTGPLTGTSSPSSGRYNVAGKSPLTGTLGWANSGGYWGPAFKANGFDGVIFKGISPRPVYLLLEDGRVELKSAEHLWGKNVSETTRMIQEEVGEEFEVVSIGVAGENLVRFACPINTWHRAPGRCGFGAVMGAKRLKAIAAKGTKETPIADPVTFMNVAKKNYEFLEDSFMKATLETYGTAMVLDMVNVRGFFPTKNFQTGVYPSPEKINSETLNDIVLVDRKACFACTIKCGRVSEIRKGKYAGLKGEGPEYETIATFGGMCFIDDIEAVTVAHNLCDDYGLDTISCGNTIGFAMECYEKGAITKADTGGLELKFGNAEAALQMIHKIAKRDGIGDLLAEGTRKAAQKLGKGTDGYAMNVKGLELPGYDPRGAKLLGLSYATSSRGACHMASMAFLPSALDFPLMIVEESGIQDPLVENPAEVALVKSLEDAMALFDSSGACKFMGLSLSHEEWVSLIAAVTGWDFTFEEFKKTGERVYNLERVFHVREGLTRADDSLPRRFVEEPMPEGPARGVIFDPAKFDMLLDAYYELRGWDKTGKPTPDKLREHDPQDKLGGQC